MRSKRTLAYFGGDMRKHVIQNPARRTTQHDDWAVIPQPGIHQYASVAQQHTHAERCGEISKRD